MFYVRLLFGYLLALIITVGALAYFYPPLAGFILMAALCTVDPSGCH